MRISKLTSNIYILTFSSRYELCMSFVRINEFCDSPRFKNKVFTLDEFMDYWVKKNNSKCFEYPAKWNAFGLSCKDLLDWFSQFKMEQGKVRDKEKKIIEKILTKVSVDALRKTYLIAMYNGHSKREKKRLLEHEIAHAMYFLDPVYRSSCNALIDKIDRKSLRLIKRTLFSMGYSSGKGVVWNEIQAYLSTDGMTKNQSLSGSNQSVNRVFRKNFLFFKNRLKTN